jgi:hypothetical protein
MRRCEIAAGKRWLIKSVYAAKVKPVILFKRKFEPSFQQ